MSEALIETRLPLGGRRQGKVRDTYEMDYPEVGGVPALVIVATDRISAFDVVMPNGVPNKGVILNQISAFWFEMIEREFGDAMAHHVLDVPENFKVPGGGVSDEVHESLRGRVTIGRRTNVIPIECVARGYLAGSGWKEYQASQTVCGVKLPAGLRQCEKLPEPIFTPATKAEEGHDENIDFDTACGIAGRNVMETLREKTLAIYQMAHDYALERGIIIADTKFEFGLPLDVSIEGGNVGGNGGGGDVILIDEVLSPDSSRFWPADRYEAGRDQDSYDKQFVRNYLEGLVSEGKWNKTAPGPSLPEDVIAGTLGKYREAMSKLMGEDG